MRGFSWEREYDVVTYPDDNVPGLWVARVEITQGTTINGNAASFAGQSRENVLDQARSWCNEHERQLRARRSQVQRHRVEVD